MDEDPLNNLDRHILYLLQVDARAATDANIASETDVTGTPIHNRIEQLEERGIILGYNPEISYERVGYPMRVLFICSTELSQRSEVAEKALEVRGVVTVREMLAGEALVAGRFTLCLPGAEVPGGNGCIREAVTPERLIDCMTGRSVSGGRVQRGARVGSGAGGGKGSITIEGLVGKLPGMLSDDVVKRRRRISL